MFGLNREIQHHVQEHHFELEKPDPEEMEPEQMRQVLSERTQACFEENPHLDPSELNLSKLLSKHSSGFASGNTFTVPSRKNPWHQIGCLEILGLDMGLKSLVTDSTGQTYEPFRGYRESQEKLAQAQSHGDKGRVKRLNQTFKHQRLDALHHTANQIINSAQIIKCGDVDVSEWARKKLKKEIEKRDERKKEKLHPKAVQVLNHQKSNPETVSVPEDIQPKEEMDAKKSHDFQMKGETTKPSYQTKKDSSSHTSGSTLLSHMLALAFAQSKPSKSQKSNQIQHSGGLGYGKAVLDSGLGTLNTLLLDKGRWVGRVVMKVCEQYSTQICSSCLKKTGPRGKEELHVRTWGCSACGVKHDRDQNAAINLSRLDEDTDLLDLIQKISDMSPKERRQYEAEWGLRLGAGFDKDPILKKSLKSATSKSSQKAWIKDQESKLSKLPKPKESLGKLKTSRSKKRVCA